MAWRTSSSNGAWTPQQRAFLAVAVLLFIIGLAICIARLQSGTPPGSDGVAPVSSAAWSGAAALVGR